MAEVLVIRFVEGKPTATIANANTGSWKIGTSEVRSQSGLISAFKYSMAFLHTIQQARAHHAILNGSPVAESIPALPDRKSSAAASAPSWSFAAEIRSKNTDGIGAQKYFVGGRTVHRVYRIK